MKFGKSIRAEARNNRGLSFVNFKFLKRLLKRSTAAAVSGHWTVAREEDRLFQEVLKAELQKVGESFWQELKRIFALQSALQERLACLDLQPDPETYTQMSFEELQSHLQSLGGLSEVPSLSDPAPSSAKTSAALFEFCVSLGKISARCKRLRRCVVWNAVAVVKILKKRTKGVSKDIAASFLWSSSESSAAYLSRLDWYCCPELSLIVSLIETMTEELMGRLTLQPPSRDRYQCPICLDVVLDPVCLRTCGHRFCWACLCMAYCERQEGTLERCPSCRVVFPLDPEAFQIDGILSRFLRAFFPDIQTRRAIEQQKNLELRLESIQCLKEKASNNGLRDADSKSMNIFSLKSKDPLEMHCCPDCQKQDLSYSNRLESQECKSHTALNMNPWERQPQKKKCNHRRNVKLGKPSDVDRLASVSEASQLSLMFPVSMFHNPLIDQTSDDSSPRVNSDQAIEPEASTLSTLPVPLETVVGQVIDSLCLDVASPIPFAATQSLPSKDGTYFQMLNPPFAETSSAVQRPTKLISMMRSHLKSCVDQTSFTNKGNPQVSSYSKDSNQVGDFDREMDSSPLPDISTVSLFRTSENKSSSVRRHCVIAKGFSESKCEEIFPEYFETIDEEDDAIEEEFVKRQLQHQQQHYCTPFIELT